MPQLASIPTAHKAGSRGYRQVTAALYGAGLASFAAMYCTQALLPALSTYYRIAPATLGPHGLPDDGNACAVDHSGERPLRTLRTYHRDADVRRGCPALSGCCCRSLLRSASCSSDAHCTASRWPGYPRWRWRIWPRKCMPLRSVRRWDDASPGPRSAASPGG